MLRLNRRSQLGNCYTIAIPLTTITGTGVSISLFNPANSGVIVYLMRAFLRSGLSNLNVSVRRRSSATTGGTSNTLSVNGQFTDSPTSLLQAKIYTVDPSAGTLIDTPSIFILPTATMYENNFENANGVDGIAIYPGQEITIDGNAATSLIGTLFLKEVKQ